MAVVTMCPLAEIEARGLDAGCTCSSEAEHQATVSAVVRGADAVALGRPAMMVLVAVVGYVWGRRRRGRLRPAAGDEERR